MTSPSNTELAYFAGLLDGEGTFTIVVTKKRTHHNTPWKRGTKRTSKVGQLIPNISFGMQSREMVNWAKKTFGGLTYSKNVANMYGWRLQRIDDLGRLIPLLLPYLKLKRPQAELLLEYVVYRQEQMKKRGRYHARYDDACIMMADKIRYMNGNHTQIITLTHST